MVQTTGALSLVPVTDVPVTEAICACRPVPTIDAIAALPVPTIDAMAALPVPTIDAVGALPVPTIEAVSSPAPIAIAA